MNNRKIKIAIVGIGNCASSLIQGIEYYKIRKNKDEDIIGLMHWDIGGYSPLDIEVVAAFDVDCRKVGKELPDAIFSEPNCTMQLVNTSFPHEIPYIKVMKGPVLDGIASHMKPYFQVDENQKELSKDEILLELKKSKTDILLNYLPVGSQVATEFYAECCLEAGVSFINCIPVFIASDKKWADRFDEAKLVIIGDDIKSQMGATIIHRMLAQLFKDRGVKLEKTYQLNTGGNTDFLNMLDRTRLESKKISKTEAVQSVFEQRLDDNNIHIGPSDYVPWLKDNKICFLRMEGKIFSGVDINLEMRLSVEDSPNSAGVVIDAIRYAKLAMDRKMWGPLLPCCSYFMKHPPVQYDDNVAKSMVERFINNTNR